MIYTESTILLPKFESEKPRTIDLLEELEATTLPKSKEEKLAILNELEQNYREYLRPDTRLDLLESVVENLKAIEERRNKLQ